MGKKSSANKDLQDQLRESAQTIWLAGLGALQAAEQEGSKVFKKLVERGREFEAQGRERAEETAEKAKTRFEEVVEDAGKALDERLTSALHRLGVPSREEIQNLTARVEELNAQLAKATAKAAAKEPPAKPAKPAKKTAAADAPTAPRAKRKTTEPKG